MSEYKEFYSILKGLNTLVKVANEYKRLALLDNLSDIDANRMQAILELAMYDDELHNIISQIDIDIAEDLLE